MKVILLHFILLFSFTAFSQDNVEDEEFQFQLVKHPKAGRVIFEGKKHRFEIPIEGDIDTVVIPNQRLDENNFVVVDKKKMIEFTTIKVAYNILDLYDFNALTITQQKKVMESFLNYEIDYYKNDLGMVIDNYKLQALFVDDRMYYFLSFDIGNKKDDSKDAIEKNIYLVTVAYNRILMLNMPLTKMQPIGEYSAYLKSLMDKIEFCKKE